MEIHYVYYSYEEFGRGYIGCRTCECLPEEDDYLGSYHDETFNPSNKIILETFSTKKEALQAEVDLHKFYQVDKNPHFANKARQKTTGFYYSSKEVVRSEEYKKKMSERLKGREIKPEWIEKAKQNRRSFEGENNPFYGKSHSKEIRDLIRQKTLEQFKTKGHPFTGRNHSEETKKKMSEDRKGNPKYSNKLTEECKQKIGQSKIGRKLWNNGKQQKFSKECPGEGWILGEIKTKEN
jgi:hypothetical protein